MPLTSIFFFSTVLRWHLYHILNSWMYFRSVSVLPILFHWCIHRPMPHCWSYWSYINVLISGRTSPFTLLLKRFPSYAYFSMWTLEPTRLGKKWIPKLLSILIGIMLNLHNLQKRGNFFKSFKWNILFTLVVFLKKGKCLWRQNAHIQEHFRFFPFVQV